MGISILKTLAIPRAIRNPKDSRHERHCPNRTRTDVAKHAAAKQIAEATAKQLAFQRNQIAAKAEDLMQDGQAVADAFFEMRGERSAIDAQIMGWVPWQSAKVRDEAIWAVERRQDLDEKTRARLLDWIAATPYFEGA